MMRSDLIHMQIPVADDLFLRRIQRDRQIGAMNCFVRAKSLLIFVNSARIEKQM